MLSESEARVHPQHLRAVAAHGLAGSMTSPPLEVLAEHDFALLMAQVRGQRITGLMWRAVCDGALPTTDEQADRVERAHVRALSGAVVLERLLIATVEALERAGVDVRVLKGTASAHLDHADPSDRTFGDIDLLVRSEDFDAAVRVLGEQGHARIHPEPRPGFDRRFSKGTSFRTADDLEIDLHRTFTMGPFGQRLDLDKLWQRSSVFTIGDRELRSLGREERFLHACYHASLGEVRPRLIPLRDLAQIALCRPLDNARLHDLIRSSRGEPVVARAVRLAWAELEIADVLGISAWAQTYRTNPAEAAELAVYGPGSSYARKARASLSAIPTASGKLRYGYALLFPRADYLGGRDAGRWDRLRRGLDQTRRVEPGS